MARGVSQNFLDIAKREQRLGQRAALAAIALMPVAALLAELADEPAYGPVWAWFLAATLLGLGAGYLLARRRIARYEHGLHVQWNHWMRHAVDATRLSEVERRVHERDPPAPMLASALTVGLPGLNIALFALLWVENPVAPTLAWSLVAMDGIVLGALLATSALLTRWAREFVGSVEDLLRKGELPIWGER